MVEQIKIRAENNASGETHASRHSRNYPSLILLPSDTGVHKNPYRACYLLIILLLIGKTINIEMIFHDP